MTVHIFFDDEVTVRRLKTVSGNQTAYRATATVWAHISELDSEQSEVLRLHPTRGYRIYVDTFEDVEEGDKIQLVQNVTKGNNQTSRTKQFAVKSIDIPNEWMVDYKILNVEELE